MDLKEWAVQYIKQRDMVKQDLVSYKEEENKVLCEYKEGKKAVFLCKENLELDNIKNIKKDETFFLVCLCNEHNFKVLADNWDLFKTKQNLTFIYLNPNIAEKWIIKPFIHAKIADPITLKQGLRTMYETCQGTAKQ
ncbi:MAG: hypothetical protein KKF46_06990 [Nanoarchaeota archaeon]|nr:hypothetical protein [Nanoarchaeota archaeon]MBU1322074.1 hypothetical protein [Nanoarchaeota archaeon]MBU1598180.1 hypothetical protein [Nanoarchaeota archaeon]MBU2441310.1 hypothetical protein [Nanoarchaeota archaeon]